MRPIVKWGAGLFFTLTALGFAALGVGLAAIAVIEAGEADDAGRFSSLAVLDLLLVPLCLGLAAVSVWLLVGLRRR